jgi:hypothetical protein
MRSQLLHQNGRAKRRGGLNCPPLFLFPFFTTACHQASLSRPPPLNPIRLLVKINGVSYDTRKEYAGMIYGMNKLPPHRSYSQLTTWQSCPQKYYLSKVAMVPEKPAVYLAAGSAVHSMLEWLNHEFYKQQQQQSN